MLIPNTISDTFIIKAVKINKIPSINIIQDIFTDETIQRNVHKDEPILWHLQVWNVVVWWERVGVLWPKERL